jgi:hypothetical protein
MCATGVFENERVYFAYGSNLHPLRVIDRFQAFTYVANHEYIDRSLRPYCWYKSLVCGGARYHRFPVAYVDVIEQTPFDVDRDEARKRKNERVLAQLASKPSDD